MLNSERMLPKFLRMIPQMGDLLDAEEPEIELLEKDIEEQVNQLYLRSSDRTLDRYERIYNLQENRGLPDMARQDALLIKHNTRSPMTIARLTQLVEAITRTDCRIDEHYSQQTISVKVYEHDFSRIDRPYLERQITVMKPAHIGFDVEIIAEVEVTIPLWSAVVLSHERYYTLTPELPMPSLDATVPMYVGIALFESKSYEIGVINDE